MSTVEIQGLQTSSEAPRANEGKISAGDGSSTAPPWRGGAHNNKPLPLHSGEITLVV